MNALRIIILKYMVQLNVKNAYLDIALNQVLHIALNANNKNFYVIEKLNNFIEIKLFLKFYNR